MPSQQLISPNLFAELSRLLPHCWQRNRGTLRPAHVLYAILVMTVNGTHGYRRVLDYLKRTVGEQLGWSSTPFPSSLSEARAKLSPEQCREAFQQIRARSTFLCAPNRVLYAGLRIVAVDMTTLALPVSKTIRDTFQGPIDARGNASPAPQATLTTLWDISANAPLDWRLEPCYASERYAAHDMIQGLGPQDLLLADRGYPSRRMFIDLNQQGASFVIRVPTGPRGAFRELRDFSLDDPRVDEDILLHEDRQRTGDPTLKVRALKMKLPNGEAAVFVTNLFDRRTHTASALCGLYAKRWDLETALREMKVWHGLEQFHAKNPEGIHQEVSALMIFMLLSAELEHQARAVHASEIAESKDADNGEIRFNRKVIAESVAHLLTAAANGKAAVDAEFEYCMKEIWKFRQRVRPGRSFPRVAKSPNSKWKRTTYNTKK